MGKVLQWIQRTSGKAEKTLDQIQKDIPETVNKIQKTLDDSNEGIKKVVDVVVFALGVSIVVNIISLGLNISNFKRGRQNIIIQHLHVGGIPNVK